MIGENMSNHSYRKFLGSFGSNYGCGRDDLCFVPHLILGGKLGICGRNDPFFALHLILEFCGRDDLQGTCPPFAQCECGDPIV